MASFTQSPSRLALLGLFALAQAAAIDTRSSSIEGKTYDYVIVGGGLSGLVVANRLTEDEEGTCFAVRSLE